MTRLDLRPRKHAEKITRVCCRGRRKARNGPTPPPLPAHFPPRKVSTACTPCQAGHLDSFALYEFLSRVKTSCRKRMKSKQELKSKRKKTKISFLIARPFDTTSGPYFLSFSGGHSIETFPYFFSKVTLDLF
jgi:hypothetical protein